MKIVESDFFFKKKTQKKKTDLKYFGFLVLSDIIRKQYFHLTDLSNSFKLLWSKKKKKDKTKKKIHIK